MKQDFRKLSNAKAAGVLAQMYLDVRGQQSFVNRKPTADWFRLRTWMSQQDRLKLNVLYDYLATLDSCHDSLSDVFEKAEFYRQEQQFKNTGGAVEEYKEININEVLKL